MRRTTALVLAGGINLGYDVLTHNRAKSALPFCGHYRIMDFVLSNLCYSQIDNVGILIQYLPGSLIDHIGVGRAWDFGSANRRIKLMPPFVGMGKTRWFRGTADAIYQNLDFIHNTKADLVLILSADHVYSMDYRPLVEYHRRHNADLTIVTSRRPPGFASPERFGYVTADDKGRVRDFVEKPAHPPHDVISTGMYLVDASRLTRILESDQGGGGAGYHLPNAAVEPIVRNGRAFAYEFEGMWEYMPDLGSYFDLHQRIVSDEGGAYPSYRHLLTNLDDRALGSRPSPFFGPLSDVRDSLISPGCTVEGAVIRSVLSPGVHVHPKAVIKDSIIFHDCVIEEGARLRGVVSDKDAVYQPYCQVGARDQDDVTQDNLTVVGKGAEVVQGVRMEAGGSVPLKQVVTREWLANRRQAVAT